MMGPMAEGCPAPKLALVVALLLFVESPASAQALRCSAFMHQHDGLWRSLSDDTVLGPSGAVHVRSGERLSPADGSAKGEIARSLDGLCEGQ